MLAWFKLRIPIHVQQYTYSTLCPSCLFKLKLVFQYGEENSYKSLVVEIAWGDNYPDSAPTVNLDTFYNKHM